MGMKRIGYVGLSTPILYDYANTARRTHSDLKSSPNPILDGAFGAMLLYDEIWFLSKSLCPQNMRNLSFVKFLDELGRVPEVDPDWFQDPQEIFTVEALDAWKNSKRDYEGAKRDVGIYWDSQADNHTHNLKIGKAVLSGNSWTLKNVIYDILTVERLPQNIEFITNKFSSNLFKTQASSHRSLQLSEVLVLNAVPQFISPKGPYHPCLEEVRNSAFLNDFRAWMVEDSLAASKKEISEIKSEVDAKLLEAQRNVFLKYLEPKGSYVSVAETLLSYGADALVPGSATIKDLLGNLNSEKQKRGSRWQGFIVEARSIVEKRLP